MDFTREQIQEMRVSLADRRAGEDPPISVIQAVLTLAPQPDHVLSRGRGLENLITEWSVFALRGDALARVYFKGSDPLEIWLARLSDVTELRMVNALPNGPGDQLGWRDEWQLTMRGKEPLTLHDRDGNGLIHAIRDHLAGIES